MSASPSKQASGPNAVTPTGGSGPPMPRKKAPVSIFTQKKKPVRRPPTSQGLAATSQAPNGIHLSQQHQHMTNGVGMTAPESEEKNFDEFSIYVSKDTSTEGLHYHAMKLQNRDRTGNMIPINPYDETQLTRPLRLHRRNARDKLETAEQSDVASGIDDKDREMMTIRRAERQAEREANQALIAPTGGDSKKPVKKKPQKKVQDVYYDENNPQQRQRAQLRYEEARPWHLEDFDNKNIWVGSYEEPLSETSVLFEIGEGGFRMVPVEKWYKFTQTNRFKVMDSDAVEKHMNKKVKAPRWFLGTQEANDEMRRQAAIQLREHQRAQQRQVYDDNENPYTKREEYQADLDEIDFEFNDEFQDDDEGMIFGEEQDEETREIGKRIFDEQRGANLAGTGVKDEDKDWDEEEQEERRREQEEKRRTKRMRKQLIKKERKNEYDSESDHGEFSESSESEDSEEERERLEEERKQEEIRKLNGDKSGASTKGTNTPTGRPEKRDTSRLGASLKRPGSPDHSELSGNESSRKKLKSLNNGRAVSTSASNGARSLSPDAAKMKRTGTGGYGSGSDTDTSRTGRPKIRLKRSPPASPHEGTPNGSRAGSPSGTGSRAQSPQRKPFPTLDEVRDAIPPEGIDIKALVDIFRVRLKGRPQTDFIGLVKQVGKQDTTTKRIMRVPPKPAEGEEDQRA